MTLSIFRPIRAVIFDVDGILIDSEPYWREAEIESFARQGITLTEADCVSTAGMRIQEVTTYWFARKPWQGASTEELAREILAGVIRRIRERGAPMPGVREAIRFLHDRGLRLALASSSAMILIDAVIDQLGIRSDFEILSSAENEPRGKPDPGVYLTTAGKLILPPEECLAIEDSINGVKAAKSAGMRCIAIPLPQLWGDPRYGQADLILRSLVDLNIEAWHYLEGADKR
jgi:mannitol-1-/sugar-/sorbitol-6-/2-deoxyglucose-6-phosphatase